MKSKKFLLGALIAVAIGSSAFNLFAADNLLIGYTIKRDARGYYCATCICNAFPTYDACMQAMSGGGF